MFITHVFILSIGPFCKAPSSDIGFLLRNKFIHSFISVSAQFNDIESVKEISLKPRQFDNAFLTTLESFDEKTAIPNGTEVYVLHVNASNGNKIINMDRIRERRSSRSRSHFRVGSNPAHRSRKNLRFKWHRHHLPRSKAKFVDERIPKMNYAEKYRRSRYYHRKHNIPDEKSRQYIFQQQRNYPRKPTNRHSHYRIIRESRYQRPEHYIETERNFRRPRDFLEGSSERGSKTKRWRDYRNRHSLRQRNPRDFFHRKGNYRRRRIGHNFWAERKYRESRNRRLRNYRRRHLSRHREPEHFFTKKTDFRRRRIKHLNGGRRYRLLRGTNMHKPHLLERTSGSSRMRITGRKNHHFKGERKYYGIRNRRLGKYRRNHLSRQREQELFTKKIHFRPKKKSRLMGERNYHFNPKNKHHTSSFERHSRRGAKRILGRKMAIKNNKKRNHFRPLDRLIKQRISSTGRGYTRRNHNLRGKKQHIKKGLKRSKILHHYTKNLKENLRKESQKERKQKFRPDCEIYKKKLQEMRIMVNHSLHKVEILVKIIGRKFGIDEKSINEILRRKEKNISRDNVLLSIF